MLKAVYQARDQMNSRTDKREREKKRYVRAVSYSSERLRRMIRFMIWQLSKTQPGPEASGACTSATVSTLLSAWGL